MSSSEDEGQYDDIKGFFPATEWKEMCSYEKRSFLNSKENYHAMERAGLQPKPPHFMRKALKQTVPKKTVSKPVPTRLQKRSLSEDWDEKDFDWSPQKEAEKKPRTSRQSRPTLRHAPAGKENVDPAASTGDKQAPESATQGQEASCSTLTQRYPKRAGSRKTYAEDVIQDDDDYIYCDDCEREYEGDCPVHGPLEIIGDTEAPANAPERALLTLPPQLVVLPSKIQGAGEGVWTKVPVARRVRFGPYEGDIKPVSGTKETGYGWEIRREGKPVYCVDALNASASNWMRFVNCARHSHEENLHPFQYKGRLYYRTVRDIPANTELLVWYGDSYGKELGIDPKAFKEPVSDARPFNGTFPCGACDLAFISPLLRAQHMRSGRCFVEKQRRRAATNAVSDSVPAQGQGASMQDCQDAVRPVGIQGFEGNAEQQRRGCAREKRFTCETCGAAFAKSTDLLRHQRIHTGDKPYTCETCGAGFTQNGNLRIHLRTHTGEKPYTCKTCGAVFARRSDLLRHLRTHTGEKPYTCKTCGAAFARSGYLRDHLRTHTGEKPYTCKTCGAAFARNRSLRIHLRKHSIEEQ